MKYLLFLVGMAVSFSAFSHSPKSPKGFYVHDRTKCPTEKVSTISVNAKGEISYYTKKGKYRFVARHKSPAKESYLFLLSEAVKHNRSVIPIFPGKYDCSVAYPGKIEPLKIGF